MSDFNRKNHWENIYNTKKLNEVSWYQPKPEISLDFILAANPDKDDAIIDIGGGDSFLADHLLETGFSNITVLDISAKAIERAKKRIGNKAERVKWIVSDIIDFTPTQQYDIWHDRAAFHFLTNEKEVKKYVAIAEQSIVQNGQLVIGTFSSNGPKKCSGIEIKQYAAENLAATFGSAFNLLNPKIIEHPTPFDTVQEFLFCSFQKY